MNNTFGRLLAYVGEAIENISAKHSTTILRTEFVIIEAANDAWPHVRAGVWRVAGVAFGFARCLPCEWCSD